MMRAAAARRSRLHALVATIVPALALLIALVIAILVVTSLVGGYDALAVMRAFWRGSFGSSDALLSVTLVRATPLILAGLAVAYAFRAGILNIGAEGQILAGAASATTVALALADRPGALVIAAALVAGAAGGAAWALLPAVLLRWFGVLDVISTIMMNFVALHGVGYLVRGPLQEPLGIYPQSSTLPDAVHLPFMVPGTRLHLGFALALVVAIGLAVVLRYTASGFRIRATGENPFAARVAGGIDVPRTGMRVFLTSGAIAGLAGAIEVLGVTFALYENISPGFGYTAIAVALLGALDPVRVALSGIFFGALDAGAGAMQRDAGVPSVLVSVIQAMIILGLLASAWLRSTRVAAPLAAPGATDGERADEATLA